MDLDLKKPTLPRLDRLAETVTTRIAATTNCNVTFSGLNIHLNAFPTSTRT